ncbi:MAG: SURF1 family protein [Dehalococcoidia bacterium]|nr:SURF1 family protein [Dehalococcoidia bacterium]
MQTKIKLRKKIYTTILLILAFLFFIILGTWQIDKYSNQKTNKDLLISINNKPQVKIKDVERNLYQHLYREITLQGYWDYENIQFSTNIVRYGVLGKDILVPFNVVNDMNILVNRGWAPVQLIPNAVLNLKMKKTNTVEGRIYIPPKKQVRALNNNEWLGFSIESISQSVGYNMSNWMIIENAKIKIGDEYTRYSILPKEFPVNQNILVNNDIFHLGYAFTWYSFSILTIFGMIHVYKN